MHDSQSPGEVLRDYYAPRCYDLLLLQPTVVAPDTCAADDLEPVFTIVVLWIVLYNRSTLQS